MTAGNNILNWYNNGSYSREIKLYKNLATLGVDVVIFDYVSLKTWSQAPKNLKDDLQKSCISIVPLYGRYNGTSSIMRLIISLRTALLYSHPFTHIKSNQTKGAWVGIILKLKNLNAKFLHRSGYSWSDFTLRIQDSYGKFLLTRFMEFLTNVFSDYIHVASKLDTKRFVRIEMKKTQIVPNWVEARNNFNLPKSEQCIFIGRLEPQKGVIDLVKAWPTHERLIIVGNGPLEDDVMEVISNRDLKAEIIPRLEHSELMKLLGVSKCLVCWSEFEGNPKVVLESLFMGVPVVAKDAPGVREIIELGNFGKLVNKPDELEAVLSSIEQTKLDYCEVKLLLRQSTFEFTLSENKRFLDL